MTSSTLLGERRWASARRSGMTVLGKVAVPKPINLPSQRLENHGLDPNVEIVPKGTLGWGSKTSSAATNAWGSSTLSPHTDSGTGSPSHLSGRPSSGGSGTRPSTAGSDRAHESVANVWGSNSRPSSASGSLTSNQTSVASLRPRSAETRPGSSQLSRFAEPLSENSVAWGGAATAEKLGVISSKNEEFSLISGDFPTLGSEKDGSGKNTEAQNLMNNGRHARPGSSGGVAAAKERMGTSIAADVSANSNSSSATANSWRRDNHPYSEDGVWPGVEKWQVDPQGPQPYPSASIPPPHYDTWRGPPINHPGGVWYRGPPGGPPYGPPVGPGGFPMEPFPYFRPQIPAAALANPQPIPPPGAGPRGHHPKNGDMYRSPMPDAYLRPGMPIRPGFYSGPVPYEGYYGPPMGYCNSNEHERSFMGIQTGPSAYNRCSGQSAADLGSSYAKPSGYGPMSKAHSSEQVEPSHPHETRGPYKVLLKQHDSWDGKDEKRDNSVKDSEQCVEKGDDRRPSSLKNDVKGHRKDEEMDVGRTVGSVEAPSQTSDYRVGGSSVNVKSKTPEGVGKLKLSDDVSSKKSEHVDSSVTELSASPKDSSLIQKIEGLNAKARISDGQRDISSVSSREEQYSKSPGGNAKTYHSGNEASSDSVISSVHPERTQATGIIKSASHEVGDFAVSGNLESISSSGTASSRRSIHGLHNRSDHRSKGRSNSHENDGWRKKPLVSDSNVVLPTNSDDIPLQDTASIEAIERSGSFSQEKNGGESVPPVFDRSDSHSQRALMRELAKQRVRERQKEEEERTRDQRTKALARLEELNKRAEGAEDTTKMSENSSVCTIQNNLEEPQTCPDQCSLAGRIGTLSLGMVSKPDLVAQIGECRTTGLEKFTGLSVETEAKNTLEEVVPLDQDVNNAETAHSNNATHVSDGGTSKLKRQGYKQRQNIPLEKNSSEKFRSMDAVELVNSAPSTELVANEVASGWESTLPVNPNVVTESSIQQRRKNNRNGKNKQKMEESLPSIVMKETDSAVTLVDSGKPIASGSELDTVQFQSPKESKDANQGSEQPLSLQNEESHGRTNNQWKSQHARRTQRNPQASKLSEKFHTGDAVMWAPVRSQNKIEVANEASEKAVAEAVAPVARSDHQIQNNSRNKRAEMERYVPKPVAKEMAQQGCNQQAVVSSVNQTVSDETTRIVDSSPQGTENTQHADSAIWKGGSAMESRNEDARPNKHGKVHGSWRQRGSGESTPVQRFHNGQSSNLSRNVQKSTVYQDSLKQEVSSVTEQPKYADDWNASDNWKIPESSESSTVVPIVKDLGLASRGKKHAYKGHKGTGSNHDDQKIHSVDADKNHVQSSSPEMSQMDLSSASKENRAVGDRSTSHWQPKSQAPSGSNQRGNRAFSSQNVEVEAARTNKNNSSVSAEVSLPHKTERDTSGLLSQHYQDQFLSDKSNVKEAPNVGQQEPRRERRMASHRGRPYSPNRGPDGLLEPASSNMDNRLEQRSSSGFRKNGNQSNRFVRMNESHGDWGSAGQDNRQQSSVPGNRDRQRPNSHYEYQPIGQQNIDKVNTLERQKDGSHNPGPRFRERGNSSRRGGGNFYGRQSGGRRSDGSYD